MPYKPKHCCQCGEKIDRADWKPWTSRRFCSLCETEFGIYDKLSWVLVGIGLAFGLFGIGIYLQKPEKQLSIVPNQMAAFKTKGDAIQPPLATQVSADANIQQSAQSNNSISQTKKPIASLATDLKGKPVEARTIEQVEKVYFCGAPTKKGTMCSRRVKNGGRCWQHEGQAAMLPQAKLVAQ